MKKNIKKDVLVVTEFFYPEEFIINQVVDYWIDNGKTVEILTRTPSYPFGKIFNGYKNKLFQKEEYRGATINRIHVFEGYTNSLIIKILNVFWNAFLGYIFALKNKTKFETVFIYQAGTLTSSLAGVLVGKKQKIPITLWVQDVWPDTVYAYGFKRKGLLKYFLEKYTKWIFLNCQNILGSCPGFKSTIENFIENRKVVHFVPNWATTTDLDNEEFAFPTDQKINFTFAGNIGKVQNLENCIHGFGKISKELDNVRLNIVGDGSNLQLCKEIVSLNNYANIKFWGRLPLTQMPSLFALSDVLIISLIDKPIFNITIPAKFQAYIYAEKPVFSIINGEVAKLTRDYDIGWVAAPNDIDDIANKFIYISKLSQEDLTHKKVNSKRLSDDLFVKQNIQKQIFEYTFNNPTNLELKIQHIK